MQRRLVWAALLAVAFVALVPARSGAAVAPIVPCNVGAIVKLADPSLSAPSPAYPGSKITSSAGSWSSCGESFTGFYAEWLRDGNVISGPTWAAGLPGAFGYVVQAADVGHRLTSALRPCNPDGCFGSFAASSNAVIPVAAPPPPPPAAATTAATKPAASDAAVLRRGRRLLGDRRVRKPRQPAVDGQPA